VIEKIGQNQQLKLKITGGFDQFAGHEVWQMEMIEADAPDEATRWRLHSEVEASWNELQGAKFISRISKASSVPAIASSAPPGAAPAAGNRGARRAAARNQPAAADSSGGAAAGPLAGAQAADSAAAAGTAAPLVQSFGVGLPPRPKRSTSK
jgi:hypothetical protein